MAKRLLPLLPDGHVYVEPYCGMASLFWTKTPSPVEVLNDLDGEIINLFRVLQNPATFSEFFHRMLFTPYSYAEFCRALEYTGDNPVMRAWAFYVLHNQGFNGKGSSPGDWSRVFVSAHHMAQTTSKWRGRMTQLAVWHDRLTRVQIDQRDALDVIKYWDSADTVFYVDPPYIAATRAKGSRNKYRHEATDDHHVRLVDLLCGIQGQAMVSGYDAEKYRLLEDAGFQRYEFDTAAYSAGRVRGSNLRGIGAATENASRTEVVWVKGGRRQMQQTLFEATQ